MEVIEVVAFPDKKHIISEFSLSGFTIGRRIGEVWKNIEEGLKIKAPRFQWFSVVMDESTDLSDIMQLAVIIHGIDIEFYIITGIRCLSASERDCYICRFM